MKLARKLCVRHILQRGPRNQDVFAALQLCAHFAHVLAHVPPNAVARYGVAHLGGYGKTEFLIPPLQMDQHQIFRGV